MTMTDLTTMDAAQILGVTRIRVCQLCIQGRIPGARRFGRDWCIPSSGLRTYFELRQKSREKKL